MAVVRPLVWYKDVGRKEDLRPGDTLPGAGGGGNDTFAYFVAG